MQLLTEGKVEELSFDGVTGAYRLTKNTRKDQPVALYIRGPCEFGIEIILGRPNFVMAARKAKQQGYHIVVAGYMGWHPLYEIADEYWGVKNWNSNKQDEARGSLVAKNRELALVTSFHGALAKTNSFQANAQAITENVGFQLLHNIDYAACGLPRPSQRAIELVSSITQGRPFITMAPVKRQVGFEARDYHQWEKLYEKLAQLGLDIYATSPKKGSVSVPCRFLEDVAGPENLMDLEIAFYSMARISITSNTGSAGLMISSNCPNVIIFGGVGGHSPGWNGVAESLGKLDGYKTKIFVPEPVYGSEDQSGDHAVRIIKGILGA